LGGDWANLLTGGKTESRGRDTTACGTLPAGSSEILGDFIAACSEIFGGEKSPESLEGAGFSYTYSYARNGGGTEGEECFVDEEIENEVSKVLGCDRTALRFLGVTSGLTYYKFIKCMRWFCSKCGSHNGHIHNKRLSSILDRLGASLQSMALRQFIFTIPPEWRPYFQSRAGLNAFIRISEKIIKKSFPGKESILYLHCFGDRAERGEFNPHCNIHVREDDKNQRFMIEAEQLSEMKKALWRGLTAYIRTQNGEFKSLWRDAAGRMNIFYSFATDEKRVKHRLRYMSRLHPNFDDYRYLKKNRSLLRLFVVDMKGFAYVRHFNVTKGDVVDVDRAAELREAEGFAGERLRFVKGGELLRREFDMLFREWDYEMVADGFYRIKEKQKEVRR